MACHMLYRFPAYDADTDIQVRLLLSGDGRPDTPTTPGGLYSLVWTGVPTSMEIHRSWIGIVVGSDLRGWVRYCSPWSGDGYFTQPGQNRTGDWVQVDKVFSSPAGPSALPAHYSNKFRRKTITQVEANALGVPSPNGGDWVEWIDRNGRQRRGCQQP